MERRVLLAFFLSFVVLFVYQSVFVPPEVPPLEPAGESGAPPAAPDPSAGSPPVPLTEVPPAPRGPTGAGDDPAASGRAAPVVATVVADPVERDVIVESEAIRAVFSNRGAVLTSWKLKRHTEQESPDLIELVPRDLRPADVRPFTLAFDDPDVSARARDALFEASVPAVSLTDRDEVVTFVFEDASGLRIRKEFAFAPAIHDYVMRVSVEATLNGRLLTPALQWGPALGGGESATSGIAYRAGPRGVVFGRVEEGGVLGDEDVLRLDASDVAARSVFDGQLRYAGVDNHYFLAAALTDNAPMTVGYLAVPLPPVEPDGPSRDLMAFELRWPDGRVDDIPFFLGPKNFESLERLNPTLVQAIDFGWTGWLVVPLHRSLTWIYDFFGNWGWAIIVLTFLINVIIFPLRHKSVVSMRKMQEIQPEMKAIQERYAHLKTADPDKQKMNQEIMALYRDRGVNPASGCLPMLLTMPVLFAFYSLLSVAVEIRGEPFVGWITDLTVPDPFFITPLVMGASMVVQQKMQPSQADPMQQKIMMLMPVMFTGMFLWAPSGLVLYWLTSNVLSIGQTVVTNRVIGPPKMRTVRPPAERRVKPRGGGKGAKEKDRS